MGRGLGSWVAALALMGCQFRIGGVNPPDRGSRADLAPPADLASTGLRDLSTASDLATQRPDLLPVNGEIDVTGPDPIPSTVDLSQEGTIDWAHCGYMNVAGVDDRRVNGPDAITVGAQGGTITASTTFTPTLSWSNGTPTASASTQSGIFVTGASHGLTVSVPASTTPVTIRIYADVFKASAQLTAHLSDASAPDYVGATITADDPGTYARFTIRFHAASAAQTLTIAWTMTADHGGSIVLLGATVY